MDKYMVYSYSEVLFSDKNKHATKPKKQKKTQRNVDCILLSERAQSETATYYMIPSTWHSGK
jgi:hypothetical protein